MEHNEAGMVMKRIVSTLQLTCATYGETMPEIASRKSCNLRFGPRQARWGSKAGSVLRGIPRHDREGQAEERAFSRCQSQRSEMSRHGAEQLTQPRRETSSLVLRSVGVWQYGGGLCWRPGIRSRSSDCATRREREGQSRTTTVQS